MKYIICYVPELFYRRSGNDRLGVGSVYCPVTFALGERAWC